MSPIMDLIIIVAVAGAVGYCLGFFGALWFMTRQQEKDKKKDPDPVRDVNSQELYRQWLESGEQL